MTYHGRWDLRPPRKSRKSVAKSSLCPRCHTTHLDCIGCPPGPDHREMGCGVCGDCQGCKPHEAVLHENWRPACGGTEQPFQTRSGRTLLYCWQPSSGRHAYLDTGTDLILSDEEARLALGKD